MIPIFLIKPLIQGNRTCHWSWGQCHIWDVAIMLTARTSDTLSPLQPLCLLPRSQMPFQSVCTADRDNCSIMSMNSSKENIKLSRHYKSSHSSHVFHSNTQVHHFSHEEVFYGICFVCKKSNILKLKGHLWEATSLHVIAKSLSEQQWLIAIYKFNRRCSLWDY